MAELAILVPSRGRPQRFRELLDSIAQCSIGNMVVYLGTDYDDPTLGEYVTVHQSHDVPTLHVTGTRQALCGWTNTLAMAALGSGFVYMASLGDDHRPRTRRWDEHLIEAIEQLPGPGFAYGNDLLQGRNMPTAWVASAGVVRALGWMMQPSLEHMFVDNVIKELGELAGRLAYVPRVIIEHVHPAAGKTGWDDSYRESNRAEQYALDKKAFEAWRAGQMQLDAATLRSLEH